MPSPLDPADDSEDLTEIVLFWTTSGGSQAEAFRTRALGALCRDKHFGPIHEPGLLEADIVMSAL